MAHYCNMEETGRRGRPKGIRRHVKKLLERILDGRIQQTVKLELAENKREETNENGCVKTIGREAGGEARQCDISICTPQKGY